MESRALPDEDLQPFLRRRRRGTAIDLPPLGPFLAETLDLARRLVPSQAGSLLLDSPKRDKRRSPLTFVAGFGPTPPVGQTVPAGRGIVGAVYRSGESIRVDEAHQDERFFARLDQKAGFQTRSVIATPVRLERAVCGVFELINRKGRRTFSDRDVELVELLSRYLSGVILNAVDIVKQNELALRDDLTGLRNARGLEEQLARIVAETPDDSDCGVLWIDVDGLKAINDRLGHRAGSEALQRAAEVTEQIVRPDDLVFRFGGDELVVLCPQSDLETVCALGEALIHAIRAHTGGPMRFGGRLPALSVSVGAATLRGSLSKSRRQADLTARLLAAGDKALYRAKRNGRGRLVAATRRDDTLGRRRR